MHKRFVKEIGNGVRVLLTLSVEGTFCKVVGAAVQYQGSISGREYWEDHLKLEYSVIRETPMVMDSTTFSNRMNWDMSKSIAEGTWLAFHELGVQYELEDFFEWKELK